MGIRKKLLPFVMAAVLAFTTAGTGFAEEVLVETEEESGADDAVVLEDSLGEESDITVLQEDLPEGGSDIPVMQNSSLENGSDIGALQDEETQSGIDEADTFSLEEGISVEEVQVVDTKDYGSEEEEYLCTEVITDCADQCGYASNAAPARIRAFSAVEYTGSYGAQLSEEAKYVYDQLLDAYVTKRSAESIKVKFKTTLAFCTEGTPYKNSEGKDALLWDKENNEEYQDVLSQIRFIVQPALDALFYDYPEVFWVGEFRYQYGISFSGSNGVYTGKISSFTTAVRMLYSGAENEVASFDQKVNDIVLQLKNEISENPDTSKVGIVRVIHDYLRNTLSYEHNDEDNPYAHSAAGVFIHGNQVVCEGYAKAFKILADRIGVESALIVGGAWSTKENQYAAHMWNYVKMEDNNWYLLDVTWDDTLNSDHKYFLIGSSTTGSTNKLISEERMIYQCFSGSAYSQCFEGPILGPSSYQDTHSHKWQISSEKTPTCITTGYRIYTCDCGATSNEELGCIAHSYHWVTTPAGCETDAYKTHRCFVCNEAEQVGEGDLKKDRKIILSNTKLGHDYQLLSFTATCTESGTATYRCSRCGATKTTTASATGHRYINYVSDGNASWNIDGTKTAICANGCGTKDTVTDSGSAKIPTITLSVSSLVLQVGQSTTALKVTSMTEGDKVTGWKSSNTKIVKINSKTGKITAQKTTGSAKVTVTLSSGLKKSITVKVQKTPVKPTKILGLSKTLSLKLSAKKTLSPVIYPITSKEKVTYTSSNKKVATVSSKGVVTAKAAGTARITVKSGTKKFVVTVKVPKITATKITNIPTAVTIKVKKTKTLKPKLYPAGSTSKITYSSSKKSVAVVSSSGKITAKKKGKTVITVKAGKAVMKCTVTVK